MANMLECTPISKMWDRIAPKLCPHRNSVKCAAFITLPQIYRHQDQKDAVPSQRSLALKQGNEIKSLESWSRIRALRFKFNRFPSEWMGPRLCKYHPLLRDTYAFRSIIPFSQRETNVGQSHWKAGTVAKRGPGSAEDRERKAWSRMHDFYHTT